MLFIFFMDHALPSGLQRGGKYFFNQWIISTDNETVKFWYILLSLEDIKTAKWFKWL